MASKHVLKLSAINEFFENDNKIIKKGENALESNHMKKMHFDASLMLIRGEIHASMKDKTYMTEINLNETGEIVLASCTCPRGIKCHHIATLALFGHYNISVTDKECTWNVPKGSDEKPVQTADELYPPKPYSAIEEKISAEAKQKLREKLSTFGNTVGFTWLLQEETEETCDTEILPIIEEIISSEEFHKACDKIAFIRQKCAVDEETRTKIASLTIGQVSNDKWYCVRKFRLTGSNFGAVIGACKRKRYPDSLFKSLMGVYNLDGVKAIQWGRTHESNGIEYMKNNLNLDIQATGIWLSKCGFLGASPDGLVGGDAIVEVKCPYSFRNDVLSEKLTNNKSYIIYYDEKGEVFINPNHNYYHQIQGKISIFSTDRSAISAYGPRRRW